MTTGLPKTINWRLFVYTRRNLLVSLAILFAAILVIAFAIWPQITSITETRAKLAKEQKELQKVTIKLRELDTIKVSEEFNQTDKVNQVLPSRKPLLEFLSGLNTIAGITQVAVSDLKVNPGQIATDSSQLKTATRKTGQANYDFLDLKLAVSGQLHDIQRFLSLIEQISPITTITQIDLNRDKKSGASGVILTKAELTLRVHYFTQQITTSLTTTLPQITSREKNIFKTIQDFTIPVAENPTKVTGGGNANPFLTDVILDQ